MYSSNEIQIDIIKYIIVILLFFILYICYSCNVVIKLLS